MGPAAGAKIVTTVILGAVGAGVFAGVSHDGRGAEPVESESVVVPPSSISAGTAPPSTAPSSTGPSFTTTTSTTSTAAAQPATPDSAPPRARIRSGGS